MNVRFSITTAIALPLLACGGGSSGNDQKDAPGSNFFADAAVDAAATCAFGDSTGSGVTPTPTFTKQVAVNRGSDFNGSAAPATQIAVEWEGVIGSGGSAGDIVFGWITFSGGGSGSNGTPDWPTSLVPKSDIDPATAQDLVAIILTDFGGSDDSAQTFYETDTQTGGVFNLTQAGSGSGDTFAGTSTNVGLVQLNDDGTAVNVDGCSTTVSLTFNATVQLEGSAAFAPAPAGHSLRNMTTAQEASVASRLQHRFH